MKTSERCVGLSSSEVDYLKTAGFLSSALLEFLQDIQWSSDVAGTLKLPAVTAEEFREAFTEYLAKVGFDESYELTAEGKLLEDLIDRFNGLY
jgi:hypothetical protein